MKQFAVNHSSGNMLKRLAFTVVVLAGVSNFNPASAESITITYFGTVESTNSLPTTQFDVGDSVEVSFTLESTTPDARPADPTLGVYFNPISDLQIRFGTYQASATSIYDLQVGNDYIGQGFILDYFHVISYSSSLSSSPLHNLTGPPLGASPLGDWASPIQFVLQLADQTGTALTSDALPIVPLDPRLFIDPDSYISLTFDNPSQGPGFNSAVVARFHSTTIVVDQGRLVGIQGLGVGNDLFDVQFVDGSFDAVFADSGTAPTFVGNEPSATDAALAIFLAINADGTFTDLPQNIGGCSSIEFCGIAIPFNGPFSTGLPSNPFGVDVQTVFYEAGPSDGVFSQPLATNETFNGEITYAVFTSGQNEEMVEYRYESNFFDFFSCGGNTLCGTPDPEFTSYTTDDFVLISLTLDDPLDSNLELQDVTNFPGFNLTLSDGQQELSFPTEVLISTDNNGNIVAPWSVISNCCLFPNNGISSINWPGGRGIGDQGRLSAPSGSFPDTPLDYARVTEPSTWTRVVVSQNEAPTANAGVDKAVRVGDTVFLDGSASFDDNTPSESLVYAWSFSSLPAGSNAVLLAPDTATPSFAIDVIGTYVVQLIVTDEAGLESLPDDVVISSDNLAPTADAGLDQLVIVGSTVFLDGLGSTDPEVDPLNYSWVISVAPVGSIAPLVDADTAFPSFIPDIEGTYEVMLVVSDFIGPSAPDSVDVMAVSPDQFAVIAIASANESIVALGSEQVTTQGNQNALTNFLMQAAIAIQAGDLTEAISKLQKAILRTDGCVLRGIPDGDGPGRDWITDCAEQAAVYASLTSAIEALSP